MCDFQTVVLRGMLSSACGMAAVHASEHAA